MPESSTKAKRLIFDLHPCKGGWEVKRDGAREKEFERKADAMGYAREQARASQPSQLRIHSREGRIQEERTYGNDPRDRRG